MMLTGLHVFLRISIDKFLCPRRASLTSSAAGKVITRMAVLENISDMRKPYRDKTDIFDTQELASKEPIGHFRSWFETACHTPEILEPNAMALATATRDGRPSVRMLLMKGFDESGFKFFTNYESRKARELDQNSHASLLFHWVCSEEGRKIQSRQVRIEGQVEKLSKEESEKYFHSRPRESQLGACVSRQSSVIMGRHVLDEENEKLRKMYEDEDSVIPKPDYWGGYILRPEVMEFWQGQTNRLHDRIVFRKPHEGEVIDPSVTHQGNLGWVYERLSP